MTEIAIAPCHCSGTHAAPGTIATTLATVNATVGTFGTATKVAAITVNAKGLVTGVTEITIAGLGRDRERTAGALAQQRRRRLGNGLVAATVARLDAANVFSSATPIILGDPSRGASARMSSGSSRCKAAARFQWLNDNLTVQLMAALANTGILTLGRRRAWIRLGAWPLASAHLPCSLNGDTAAGANSLGGGGTLYLNRAAGTICSG